MQVPEGPRYFALLLNVQIGTEAYPGVQGAFSPGKIGGDVNPSSAEVKMCEDTRLLLHIPS